MKSFACIVPAYNEQEMLPLTLPAILNAIKAVKNFQGRLIVVDNNSTDNTATVAKQFGAEVVFEPVNHIAKARNKGANSVPEVDYLFFIDADTYLTPELLQYSLNELEFKKVCGGGCLIKMDSDKGKFIAWSWKIITSITNLAAGAYIFCLNRAFKETGGFNENIFAAEDVFFSAQLKKWGKKNDRLKFKILKKFHIVTSDRKLRWYSRWQIIKMLTILTLMPWHLKRKEKLNFWYQRPTPKNNSDVSSEVNKK